MVFRFLILYPTILVREGAFSHYVIIYYVAFYPLYLQVLVLFQVNMDEYKKNVHVYIFF